MKGLQFLWRITPFILGLSQNACAYQPGTGSFVAGNLSIAAPYGIPPAEFRTVTKRLTSAATFNITGYNVSVDATPQSAISGWTLTVGITTDVSLVDASSSSNFDVEATTLYIEPPGGKATVDPSWEICAVVFPGLASSVNTSRTVNGSCEAVLSSECIQAVQTGNSGISSNGTCGEYVLPSACRDEFPSASVNSTAISMSPLVSTSSSRYFSSVIPHHSNCSSEMQPSTRPFSTKSASTHMAVPRRRHRTRQPI